ncbi:MAG: PTS system mannose/fructose/sorbose family transporter subunit IID [Elusimicrobiota bacterium]
MKISTKILIRAMFLQSVWNYERMQNVGFLFSILPQLKRLYGENRGKLIESCRRHSAYFNTHPYLVHIILGFTARQEERISKGEENAVAELKRFKLQMAGPLAAIGDKLFWAIWRPLIGILGVMLFFIGVKPYWIIPLVFIIAYNLPIELHKRSSLLGAYENKLEVAQTMKNLHQSLLMRMMQPAGLLFVGVILCSVFFQRNMMNGLLFLGGTLLVVIMKICCNLSATKLLYLVSGLVFLLSMVV